MKDYKKIIGNNIRSIRKSKGLRQEDIGKLFGKSDVAVAKWESGKTAISADDLFALCDYFGVTADEIAGRSVITSDDREVLNAYHSLSDAEKPLVRRSLGLEGFVGEWEEAVG